MTNDEYRENVFGWLDRSGGRYLKRKALEPLTELAGVIVHDDGNELADALCSYPYPAALVDVGNRFTAWSIRRDDRHILLVGTGMGSANGAVLIYELAAALRSEQLVDRIPVLKIGTCPSTWRKLPVGSVLVPRWAIADEGVTQWNFEDVSSPKEWFGGKSVPSADEELTGSWFERVSRLHGITVNYDARKPERIGVWSTDALFPVIERPDFFDALPDDPEIVLSAQAAEHDQATALRTVQSLTEETCRGREEDRCILAAWDMESSCLFSSAQSLGVRIAAGLVVTYTKEYFTNIGKQGDPDRPSKEGDEAHEIEDELIVAAADFLFSQAAIAGKGAFPV